MVNRLRFLYFTLILLVSGGISFGQNIVQAEYFIDHDLGVGNNTPITISNGSVIDQNFDAITTGLAPGTYTIHIRTKDDSGVWGFTEAREFLVKAIEDVTPPPVYDVAKLEFFINQDPGVGMGTDIPVAQASEVEVPSTILPTSGLSAGYHTVGLRAQNTNGNWGFYELRQIYVTPSSSVSAPVVYDVAEIEYFFDTDPGVGMATKWPSFIQNNELDLNEILTEASALSPGQHTIVVRSRNTDGTWGFYERRQILINTNFTANTTTPNIVKMEYFFDGNDPGVGSATELAITPGTTIDLDPVDVPTPGNLIDGQHTFSIRAQDENGMWSMIEIDTFDVLDDCTQPIASFDPQLACAGSQVIFNNTSTDLQGDATYRWYLDGDAVVDETAQNASFTYPFPGTYVVALAVRQGTICLDSISTTIEIQPQPVAVFSTSGETLNQATSFAASASNLPAGAVWEWDFDGDFTIDDNTAGSISHTYTTTGTFNPILTITDNQGCFISVTNSVTISNGGGGGGSPSVNFLASSSCVGTTVSFIDLSQNLPAGATYSWDFDGDGQEDSTTPGNNIYTFPTAGSFEAALTIDFGGNTITANQTVEIVDIPVVDFTAAAVCEGLAMNFVNLSTPGQGNNQYEWDFNNDGTVDSNASTDITYTYELPGSYIVSMKINNGYSCEQEIVKQVNVVARPKVNFDWNLDCANTSILFSNQSLNTLDTAKYIWDFAGDMSDETTRANAEYSFGTSGSKNVTLTISNIPGCEASVTKPVNIYDIPEVSIDIIARCYGQESQILDLSNKVNVDAKYYWDFGNNDGEIETSPGDTSYTYPEYNSYLVSLRVENSPFCQASTEALVEFADAATPDFATNKLCEGEEVVFTNLSTDVNPAAIYSWDFDGDGLEDSANPGSTVFTYQNAGTYNATLTIDNGGNCLADKVIPLAISPPPAVDLGPDEVLCEAGTVILDAGVGYNAYFWPDGSTQQTYTVDQIGEYVVRVQDALLCFNTDTINLRLQEPPVPSFDYRFDLAYSGIRIEFENKTVDLDSSTYNWDFGNGIVSTEINPSIIYDDFSFYKTTVFDVCLTAINNCFETEICETIVASPTAESMDGHADKFKVYPTLVESQLFIELADHKNFDRLIILDINGKEVWGRNQPGKHIEINFSAFSAGTYLVFANGAEKQFYKKIIKE